MFEIIMLLGFLLAATSQILPDKTTEADDDNDISPTLFAAQRKIKVHVYQDRKRSKTANRYLRAG